MYGSFWKNIPRVGNEKTSDCGANNVNMSKNNQQKVLTADLPCFGHKMRWIFPNFWSWLEVQRWILCGLEKTTYVLWGTRPRSLRPWLYEETQFGVSQILLFFTKIVDLTKILLRNICWFLCIIARVSNCNSKSCSKSENRPPFPKIFLKLLRQVLKNLKFWTKLDKINQILP